MNTETWLAIVFALIGIIGYFLRNYHNDNKQTKKDLQDFKSQSREDQHKIELKVGRMEVRVDGVEEKIDKKLEEMSKMLDRIYTHFFPPKI